MVSVQTPTVLLGMPFLIALGSQHYVLNSLLIFPSLGQKVLLALLTQQRAHTALSLSSLHAVHRASVAHPGLEKHITAWRMPTEDLSLPSLHARVVSGLAH